jgi:DNA-binding MarR family transcriptional regulator
MSKFEQTHHPETGEIGYFVPLDSGAIIETQEQKEARRQWAERERMKGIYRGLNWVACYHEPIRNITNDLTLIEAGAVIKLLPFLRFKKGGKLIENGKPLMQKDIQDILGRSKRSTITILDRLVSLGVIQKEPIGRSNIYSISVEFHTMGKVTDGVRFTKLFQVKAREITKDLDLNEVGFLYKILPYFHYQNYYLCANPDDDEETCVIQHLNRPQLAEAIGHDVDTVTTLVKKLQSKGIILTTGSRNTIRYLVHPDIMFRGEYENKYTVFVRRMFTEHLEKI